LTRCIYADPDKPHKFNHGNSWVLAQMYLLVSKSGQAIEEQPNKGENANQFSKATSFGNHHDFLYGEKVEQELARGLSASDQERDHLLELPISLPENRAGARCQTPASPPGGRVAGFRGELAACQLAW
jgi:hypothetical protein